MPVERIAARPMDTNELLELAVQVVDGLDAAHGKGIIHRDIKPANISVTTRGQPKILHLGLAQLALQTGPAPGVTEPARTIDNDAVIEPGVAVGAPPTCPLNRRVAKYGMSEPTC